METSKQKKEINRFEVKLNSVELNIIIIESSCRYIRVYVSSAPFVFFVKSSMYDVTLSNIGITHQNKEKNVLTVKFIYISTDDTRQNESLKRGDTRIVYLNERHFCCCGCC